MINNKSKTFDFQINDSFTTNKEIDTAAIIFDTRINEPILFIDCVRDLHKRSNQYVCYVGKREAMAPHLKGHYFGLVYIDPFYFDIFIKQLPHFGKIMFMHELGHYINNDYTDIEQARKLNAERIELIKKGKVQECELAADRFAVEQCGLDDFVNFIDFMIELRKKRTYDPGREFALKEFELRKAAAADYKK